MNILNKNYRKEFSDNLSYLIEEQPISIINSWPVNAVTNLEYDSATQIYLALIAVQQGYDDPRWCTKEQCISNGWGIKADAVSQRIESFSAYDLREKRNLSYDELLAYIKNPQNRSGIKFNGGAYQVFNAKHVERIPTLGVIKRDMKKITSEIEAVAKNNALDFTLADKVKLSEIGQLHRNAGYYILAESKSKALGFSPTAPSAIVIWDRTSDGYYANGHYGNTLNLFEIADLRFIGMDIDGALSKLENIGFDWREKPVKEIQRAKQQLELPNYTDTWSSVDEMQVGSDTYYLMENDKYGDEMQYLIIDSEQNIIADNVYNGFSEPEFVEYLENVAEDINKIKAFSHIPIDIEQSSTNKIIDDLSNPKPEHTVKLKSIITQSYDSDTVSHTITATHTRGLQDIFDDLYSHLENNEDMEFFDYVLKDNQLNEPIEPESFFTCLTDWGASEGIYTDIFINSPSSPQPTHFATIKTLGETDNDYLEMSRIGATAQLLLNGNGRTIEFTQEKNKYTFPKKILSQTALSVMQPLLDEIAEYESDFEIPTFHFEGKSPNEIVEHLENIKNIIQNNALKSYDEPFIPSQGKSAYPVNIHNPYSNTFQLIGYSKDRAYTFSMDEYKALEKLSESIFRENKTPVQKESTNNPVSLSEKLSSGQQRANMINNNKSEKQINNKPLERQ